MIVAQTAGVKPTSADPMIADRTTAELEWSGLQLLQEEPGWMAAAVCGLLVVLALTIWMYRRERHSVGGPTLYSLLLLRLIAISGVIAMLLGPQQRTAETITRPSKLVVLVDSSLSMAFANREADQPTSTVPDNAAPPDSRTAAAVELLLADGLLTELANTHQVQVAPTDSASNIRQYVDRPALPTNTDSEEDVSEAPVAPTVSIDTLAEFIRPAAARTRLAEALDQTLEEFAGEPLAGIVLLTDGQNNAGPNPQQAAARAAERNTPIATIGFGPLKAGINVVVRELIAPRRAVPNDEIELSAVVETTGPVAAATSVSLYRRLESDPEEAAVLLETETINLGPGDKNPAAGNENRHTIVFKITPETVGSYRYSVRVAPIARETQLGDNSRTARIEVIDRETTVLLWAGGPGRDYQFLRNRLKRDDTFLVDVLLQSSTQAATQDARSVLQQFPETMEALDEYDVLVAIDPDWSELTESQIEMVEKWIARRGAGLYFAPGPVNTPRWSQRSTSSKLKSLLPVTLPDRLALLAPAAVGGARKPIPVSMTRSGDEAQYLWLTDSRTESNQAWNELPGFYRMGQVSSVKPGTTVLAEWQAADGSANVPLFAEQFYGAGRSFYSGTTELWRLRTEDPNYFNTLTTQLVRHLAEGRLLAANRGGSLLFDRETYQLGDTIRLRAIVPDLEGDVELRADLIDPRGNATRVNLKPSETETAVWVANLLGAIEGTYEAVLETGAPTPLSAETEIITPAAERDRPLRNEPMLKSIAAAGTGHYYANPAAVMHGTETTAPLAKLFPSREESRLIYGKPDVQFALKWSQALLAIICGALFIEWLTRRLSKLA